MAGVLKYIVDEKGDKTSVLVPIRTWEKINQEYTKLQNKLKVFTGINEDLSEVKEVRKSGKKLQTLVAEGQGATEIRVHDEMVWKQIKTQPDEKK